LKEKERLTGDEDAGRRDRNFERRVCCRKKKKKSNKAVCREKAGLREISA
jgi:hypothetical protein